jgi:hypothetical protein
VVLVFFKKKITKLRSIAPASRAMISIILIFLVTAVSQNLIFDYAKYTEPYSRYYIAMSLLAIVLTLTVLTLIITHFSDKESIKKKKMLQSYLSRLTSNKQTSPTTQSNDVKSFPIASSYNKVLRQYKVLKQFSLYFLPLLLLTTQLFVLTRPNYSHTFSTAVYNQKMLNNLKKVTSDPAKNTLLIVGRYSMLADYLVKIDRKTHVKIIYSGWDWPKGKVVETVNEYISEGFQVYLNIKDYNEWGREELAELLKAHFKKTLIHKNGYMLSL